SVTPNTGPALAATTIRIIGTGFQQGATVALDNIVTPSVFVTNNQITATTPARAAGAVDVVVTNPNGQTARFERGYTYILFATGLRITSSGALSAAGES